MFHQIHVFRKAARKETVFRVSILVKFYANMHFLHEKWDNDHVGLPFCSKIPHFLDHFCSDQGLNQKTLSFNFVFGADTVPGLLKTEAPKSMIEPVPTSYLGQILYLDFSKRRSPKWNFWVDLPDLPKILETNSMIWTIIMTFPAR